MIGSLRVSTADLLQFAAEQGIAPAGESPVEVFDGVEPIDVAGPSQVTFCRFDDDRGRRWLEQTRAGAIFILPQLAEEARRRREALYLPCEVPRFGLLRFVMKYWQEPDWPEPSGRNPDIHETARIGADVKIGAFSVIGPNVVIGDGSRIGSGTSIQHAVIGRDCSIGSNVAIGGEGYGYEDDEETGEVFQFPHIGSVRIGDRVRVGSSTCVDRAALGETVIGDDSKIDNLVHIAHNVRVGRRCKIVALAIIGGSVDIGDGSWIAPASAVRDWRSIGKNALVGLGAVVTKDVPDGATVVGNPARPIERTTHRYR
jgi:UDP-3-O-[3-hydroxymyristoyl] glucosamine N-acyltransferase